MRLATIILFIIRKVEPRAFFVFPAIHPRWFCCGAPAALSPYVEYGSVAVFTAPRQRGDLPEIPPTLHVFY